MLLVFVLLGIIIFSSAIALLFMLSTVRISLQPLHIWNENKKWNIKIKLQLCLCLGNRIPLFRYTLFNSKIKKWITTGKIDVKKLKSDKDRRNASIKALKKIELEIEELQLEGFFSTIEPIVTAGIYALLQAIIPIFIARKMKGEYRNTVQFLNVPQNQINIQVRGIFSIKMVNIIHILMELKKKGGKENGKSSNRSSYAYSYE